MWDDALTDHDGGDLDEVTTSVVTGQYVDPRAGRVTFETFYAEWVARQVWEATTVLAVDLAASRVPFAQLPLAELRRSHIEQWVKHMSTRGLAPGTVRTRVNNVCAVLRADVRDRVIASDPSDAVTLPRLRRAEAAMTLPTNGAGRRGPRCHGRALPRHRRARRLRGPAPGRGGGPAGGRRGLPAAAARGAPAVAAGCDVVTVQRALGHARAATTLNTYAHLWPTAEDRMRRAAGDLLAGVLRVLADRVRTNGNR